MKRTFTHISDIVSGILALIEKKKLKYELYNLGGDESTTLLDLIKIIELRLGKKATMNMLPMQAGDVPAAVADTSKACCDLNYSSRVSIEDGVADFVDWFIENKKWLLRLKDPK